MKFKMLAPRKKRHDNLESILKSRDITLPTKILLVKAMVFPVVMYGCERWTIKKLSTEEYAFGHQFGVFGEDSWESLALQGGPTSPSWRKSDLNIHWKDWCWNWSSTWMWRADVATWCEEPTHWKRPWCWEGLRAGGEGGTRVQDDWMASLTRWAWHWANSRRQWRRGEPGMLQSRRSQRVEFNLATEQEQ